MAKQIRSPLSVIKGYFNALPDKQREQETVEQISTNAVFRGVEPVTISVYIYQRKSETLSPNSMQNRFRADFQF